MSRTRIADTGGYTIGATAKRSGVNAKAIRYYESIGLLAAAERAEGGFRTFSDDDVDRLKLIGRARRLGFSLPKIKRLVALYEETDAQRHDLHVMILDQVAEIDRRMTDLRAIRATLLDIVERDAPWRDEAEAALRAAEAGGNG